MPRPSDLAELEHWVRSGRISMSEFQYYRQRMSPSPSIRSTYGFNPYMISPSVTLSSRDDKPKKDFFLKKGDKVEAADISLYQGKQGAYIVVTDVDYDDEVDFDIYDEEDNKVGNASAYIKNGQVRKYVKKEKLKISFDSVIIPDEKKEQIFAAISQMDNHKRIFEDWGFGKVFEKGTAISLLFYGPPGTGKTLAAQAVADQLGLKLKVIQSGEVESSEPGQCERNIKAFFQNAVQQKQLLLFDECDSLINDRSEVGMILAAQINALLTALENYTGVVVFTTNRLGKMDPAFERRVSAKIGFDPPTEEQRLAIWKRMLPKEAPIHPDIDLKVLAKVPLSGGNIKNAVLNAARYAAYKGKPKIDADCFAHGVRKEVEAMKGFRAALAAQPRLPSMVGMERGASGLTKTVADIEMAPAAQKSPMIDLSSPPSHA